MNQFYLTNPQDYAYFPNIKSENTDEKLNPKRISFLLGAGASKSAGVPTTFEFVEEFNKKIDDSDDKKIKYLNCVIQEKIQKRLNNGSENVDVEVLLRTLNEILNLGTFEKTTINAFLEESVIYEVFHNDELNLNNDDGIQKLIKNIYDTLLNFIRAKVIIPKSEIVKIEYLSPLKAFFDSGPLNIYSVNYDTAIEQFCAENRLNFTDGFDEAWNPGLFDDEKNFDIKLFKIHGSITWYKTEYNRFIKSLVRGKEESSDKIELITGEKAENLMIYPAQKYEYYEPLFELLMKMKENLLKSCDILFIVGYSFRDDHIRQLIWDVARKNKDLFIVLIGPDSWQIYKNRLRSYDDDNKILSSINSRVICLPYYFEKIFPHLIDFIKELNNANEQYKDCIRKEIKGETANILECWISCLLPAIKSYNHERFNNIFNEKLKEDDNIFTLYNMANGINRVSYIIECLTLNIIQHISIYGENEEDKKLLVQALHYFKEYLIKIFDKVNYSIEISEDTQKIVNIKYNHSYIIHAFDSWRYTIIEIQKRGKLISEKNKAKFERFEDVLKNIKDIFLIWYNDSYVGSSKIEIIISISDFLKDIENKKDIYSGNNHFYVQLSQILNPLECTISNQDDLDKKIKESSQKIKKFNENELTRIFDDF